MKSQKKIKNIIFDLGGVVLNINYKLTAEAFKELGIKNFDAVYSQAKQNNVFDSFETGALSATKFRSYLKQFIPNTSDAELDLAWNKMLLDLPIARVELLKSLKDNYRIFLLSNTNEIHVQQFSTYVNEVYGEGLFENLFENHYYSNEIELRKPTKEAFEYVVNQNSLKAKETLFIDDSIQHIEGAKQIGLNTILLEPGTDLTSLFLDKFLLEHHW
jgi:putative hydrolase of the HAD superfamily